MITDAVNGAELVGEHAEVLGELDDEGELAAAGEQERHLGRLGARETERGAARRRARRPW